jgi:Tfp pilus assembly protein PilN
MRAVNLLPKEVQRASAQRPYGPVLIGVLLVLAAAGLLFKMRSSADQQIVDRQTQIDAITHKPVQKPPDVTDGQRQAAAEEGPRITALDSALKTRVPWDNVLRQISLVVPDDVHLTTLSLAAPKAADVTTVSTTAADHSGVKIEGYSYSQDGVARFLARLQVVPALQNVQLASSVFGPTSTDTTSTDSSGDPTVTGVVRFEVSADVVSPAVTS